MDCIKKLNYLTHENRVVTGVLVLTKKSIANLFIGIR
jgi:hypothetical protein